MIQRDTNWYIITGGPSSGKSTLLTYLQSAGYLIIPEVARTFIDEEIAKGKSLEEIRSNERAFQRQIFQRKIDLEEKLPSDQLTFLERGIPDSIAYYRLTGDEVAPVINASQKRKYRRVFLLEQVPFVKDYARTENEERANIISNFLHKAYEDVGYEVTRIPLLSIPERAEILLKYIEP